MYINRCTIKINNIVDTPNNDKHNISQKKMKKIEIKL